MKISSEINMKAIVIKNKRDINLEKVLIPKPKNDEILIKVAAAAICHTDFVAIDGEHSMIKYPFIPGHEFSGIVEEVGNSVWHIKPGDRVTALGYSYCGICHACRRGIQTACEKFIGIPFHYNGAFAQYIVVPSISVYQISDSLRFEDAALVEPAANAFSIVERAGIYPGENILIAGPGPIGLFATQFAALKIPNKLIMTGTRDERLDVAKKLGATDIINIKKENIGKRINKITDDRGIDVILYCGGGQEVWDLAEKVIRPYGRFIIEALPQKVKDRFQVTPFKIIDKQMAYLGVAGYSAAHFGVALDLIEKKIIKSDSIITHQYSIDDYMSAFETAEKRKDGAIKVLFNIL